MIKTIIKREFLENLVSFKFIACVLIAIVLVSISTVVLTNNYLDRLEDFNKGTTIARESLQNVPVYSYLELGIFKRPAPLSIFVSGLEGKRGNHVYLTHREIPTTLKGGLIKNEFSHVFSFFDLSSVVVFIFSLLAIMLSYESVSGEKEKGVLSLILSNSIPRYKFLLGKYIGGLISLVVPLTLCFTSGILIVLFLKEVEIDSDFFVSMFFLYFISILYLSSILLIGIFVSSRAKTSFNSLIFLLALYLITVFLLPSTIQSYAERKTIRDAKTYEDNINELMRERNVKLRRLYNEIPVKRSWAAMIRRGNKFILKKLNPEETIEFYKRYYSEQGKMMMDFAQRIHELNRMDFHSAERIRKSANTVLAFLPSANFERTSELTATTGQDTINQFFQQITLYWHQYIRYLEEKNAFSLKYFYPYERDFTPEERELLLKIDKEKTNGIHPKDWKYSQEPMKYNPEFEYLNLNDMPVFTFHRPDFLETAKIISFNLLILFFYNMLFFILAYYSFIKYDPRAEL